MLRAEVEGESAMFSRELSTIVDSFEVAISNDSFVGALTMAQWIKLQLGLSDFLARVFQRAT
jgi:hypothetical protein